MGISLDSLSITSAFNSILSFFKSQENNSKWKDMTSGAEGTFLIRMLANILSNISYRLVTARRENYLSTANLKSSALGIALNLGYSAHRGTNQKRKIKFQPNSDYVIPPFTVIGTYNDEYDVIYIGEKDAETHLRDGLVLVGPFNLGNVQSMSTLTKNIVLSADVSNDLTVGDTIDISGSVPEIGNIGSDGLYTITAINVKEANGDVSTVLTVKEDIPHNCVFSQSCIATRIGIQEFKTVVGKIKTISWTAGTTETKPFTRFEENISEDYILYLDGEEVPVSNAIKDLNNDNYLVRTNPYSSIDVLYLNHLVTNMHKYGSESNFTLKYIELADIPHEDYSPNMSGYGTVIDTLTIDNYVPFEELNDIKINAPIDHSVQHLIRSKKDFTQRAQQSIANIKETSYKSITPTYALLTYLKDDSCTIQQAELNGLHNALNQERYFGTPNPDLAHPIREAINLVIQIFVTDKLKDANDIRYDINNIIKTNYSKALASSFDTYSLERLIEQLSYVKWARVSYDVGEWISRGTTDLGSIIRANDTYYKASKILGVSGGTQPLWNIPIDTIPLNIDLDDIYETIDGGIVWRAYKRLDVENIEEHRLNSKYSIGDYVYDSSYPNFMFKAVDLIKSTGATSTLDVGNLVEGDFIADGEIVWVCKEYSSYYQPRQASTQYRLGASCNIGSKSFEVVSYIGKTGYIGPTFERAFYNIVDFVSPKVILDFKLGENGFFQLAGDQRQYFELGSSALASTDRGQTQIFTVYSVQYNENTDKTNVYLREEIDTVNARIVSAESDPAGSIFKIPSNKRSSFKIGDHITALGTKIEVSTGNKLNVSYKYTIIDTKVDTDKATGSSVLLVTVKGSLPSNVKFEGGTLLAAGYTTLQSQYNNSFIVDGDVTAFFNPKGMLRAVTDENVQMTYSIKESNYQGTFNQTYIKVQQEIPTAISYTRLAPSWVGTLDGEIMWSIINDITTIEYDWNVYNDINYKSIINR
jgi:hypothetical protein